MLSSTASTLLRLVGWSYVPEFAAQQLLNAFHYVLRLGSFPIPQRGTPAWQKHYRYTFVTVILGYLTYNLLEASWSTPYNFYEILGVSPDADENALKYAFRSFARRNHPDRVGPQGEELFIAVRDAFEVLKNPVARFAYDRFGPDAMTWRDCVTPKEYLRKGLLQGSGFYIGTFTILLFMSAIMKPNPVAFWRYLLLAAMFASELSLLLSYRLPWFFSFTFPNRVAFQHVLFLHQLFVFFSVALTRVIPALFPSTVWAIRAEDPRTYAPLMQRLLNATALTEREVSRVLQTELYAIHNKPLTATTPLAYDKDELSTETLNALTKEMENMLIEHNMQLQAPLQPLWHAAVEKFRQLRGQEDVKVEEQSVCEDDAFREQSSLSNRPSLPSPPGSVSPVEQAKKLEAVDVDAAVSRMESVPPEDANGLGLRLEGAGTIYSRLPSPRPSPSPPPSFAALSPAISDLAGN